MKIKNVKKVLTAVLAAVTVMASATTVCASGSGYDRVPSSGVPSSGVPSSGVPGAGTSEKSVSSSEGQAAHIQSYAEQKSVAANALVTVGGKKVKTTVEGVYAATSVQGCAIKSDMSSVRAALGLKSGQKPVVIIYDTDVKKSSKAMASVNAAVEALGGQLVATLNIDLGAKENGKWVTLKDGSIAMTVGLPKNADTAKKYSVVCVQPGGVTTILENKSTDVKTVVFEVQAGLGTYAIVAQ